MNTSIEKYQQLLLIKEQKINHEIHDIEARIREDLDRIETLKMRMACKIEPTSTIVPELEISRLQFQLKLGEQIEALLCTIREEQARLLPLTQEREKLKRSLFQVEQKLERQAIDARGKAQAHHARVLDEWALFNREGR